MRKQTYITLGALSFLLLAGSISSYFLFVAGDDEPIAKAETVTTTTASTQSQSNSSDTTIVAEFGQPNGQSSTNPTPEATAGNNQSLQVLGQSSQGQSSQQQNQASPGPETFAEYDQYVNDEGALWADLAAGEGDQVKAGDRVAVFYKGWLTNGELFDQSRPDQSGEIQPFVFDVGAGRVIQGWEQAIIGMQVGGSRRFIIPPVVGYGEAGQGSIPPNAVLVFDVELAAMQPAEQ